MKALIACVAFVATSASAQSFFNGNKLLGMMDGSPTEIAIAMGYIAGVADLASTNNQACFGNGGVSIGQLRDLVKRYLEAAPEVRHYDADILVSVVYAKHFPCKKGTKL